MYTCISQNSVNKQQYQTQVLEKKFVLVGTHLMSLLTLRQVKVLDAKNLVYLYFK